MTEQNQATDITADDAEGHFFRGTASDKTQGHQVTDITADDTEGHACPRVVDADDDDVRGHTRR